MLFGLELSFIINKLVLEHTFNLKNISYDI